MWTGRATTFGFLVPPPLSLSATKHLPTTCYPRYIPLLVITHLDDDHAKITGKKVFQGGGGGGGGEAGHRVVSEACTCWHVKIYIHRHAAHLGPGKGWEGRVRRHRERPGGQRKVREDRGRSVGDTKKSGEDLGVKDETLIGESCDCLMISVHFRPLWWA